MQVVDEPLFITTTKYLTNSGEDAFCFPVSEGSAQVSRHLLLSLCVMAGGVTGAWRRCRGRGGAELTVNGNQRDCCKVLSSVPVLHPHDRSCGCVTVDSPPGRRGRESYWTSPEYLASPRPTVGVIPHCQK